MRWCWPDSLNNVVDRYGLKMKTKFKRNKNTTQTGTILHACRKSFKCPAVIRKLIFFYKLHMRKRVVVIKTLTFIVWLFFLQNSSALTTRTCSPANDWRARSACPRPAYRWVQVRYPPSPLIHIDNYHHRLIYGGRGWWGWCILRGVTPAAPAAPREQNIVNV